MRLGVWLMVRSGSSRGDVVDVAGPPVVIGRDPNCTLVLDDDRLSRHHAVLRHAPDGRVELRDLDSTNGTFVEGTRVAGPVWLRGGELITVGSTEVILSRARQSSPLPVATAQGPARRVRRRRGTRVVLAGGALLLVVASLAAFIGRSGGGGGGSHTKPMEAVRQKHTSRLGSEGRSPRTATDVRAARSSNTALLPPSAASSFADMARSFKGQLGLAVAPVGAGTVQTLGDASSGHAWSTMKVPVLVTLLSDIGGAKKLSQQEHSWATAALTRSDNAAALDLVGVLKKRHGGLVGASQAIQRILRRAGDDRTIVNTRPNQLGFSTFGQTEWSSDAAVRFYRAVARHCLLPADDSAYVLGLMRQVQADQRWGLGRAGYSAATPLAFKGGWGPEDGGPYLVRQSGIVGKGQRAYVVTIIAHPSTTASASFGVGQSMVTAAAAWLRRRVGTSRPVAPARCGAGTG